MSPRLAVGLLCLMGSVSAQTFIVDAANGPGTNYTSIAAATAVVPDGSTLLVQPGNYTEFVIDGKGLTVLGGPGVIVSNNVWTTPAFVIRWVGAGQRTVVRGVQLGGNMQSFRVLDCQGAVVIEDLTMSPAVSASFGVGDVWIRRCEQIAVRHCTASEALFWVIDSRIVFESCTIHGQVAQPVGGLHSPSSHAVMIEGGSTEILDSTLVGGAGHPNSLFGWNRAAIEAVVTTSPSIRVLAPSTVTGPSAPGLPPAPAIGGHGALRLDPGVVIHSSAQPPIDQTVTTVTAPMPVVLGQSAGPGGALTAAAPGPVGIPVILVLGLPGPPLLVPGIADSVWLDPAVYAFIAIGVPQTAVPLTGSVAVPANPTFRGVVLGWQSVAATPNGLEASNPSWTLVH